MRAAVNRLSSSLVSLAILVTLTFFMAHLTPGGPAYAILGLKATPASVNAVNMKLGLDVPIWTQFVAWVSHLAQGQLGYSYLLNQPVATLLRVYELNTLAINAIAVAASTLLAIGIGLVHGVHYERWPGRVIGGLQLAVYALPAFFIATLLILYFAMDLHWLPAGGISDVRTDHPGLGDVVAHMVLPTGTLIIVLTAAFSRYFAQAVHEELSRDYVRTALSKGIGWNQVLFGHVLRNALRPLITVLGLSFPFIFTGGVVIETVFGYPGLGWLLWRSALSHDYPVLVAIVLLIGIFTVLGNLLADMVNTWLDPRTRYE